MQDQSNKKYNIPTNKIVYLIVPVAIVVLMLFLFGILNLVKTGFSFSPDSHLNNTRTSTNTEVIQTATSTIITPQTSTSTPASSSTSISNTFTLTPTELPTLTLTPVPSPTPKDIFDAAGFTPVSPLYPVGSKIGDILEVIESFSYSRNSNVEFIHAITFNLPGFFESLAFNRELKNPQYIPKIIVDSLGGNGVNDMEDLPGEKINNTSRAITFTTQINASTVRLDVIMFRVDSQGSVVVVGYPIEQTAPINPFLVAQELMR